MAKLEAPSSYTSATVDERDAVVNGCGPEGASNIVPDSILGVDVLEACRIHDWEYQHGEDIRSVVDARFLRNLRELVDARRGPLRPIRRLIVWWYSRAVQLAGDAFFSPSGGKT